MQLAQSFEVAAPIDRVWRALIDIEQVAPLSAGSRGHRPQRRWQL